MARTDPASPIAGMPILDVDKAGHGRGHQAQPEPWFRRHPNPLFAADSTLMRFAGGMKAPVSLLNALKQAAA